MEAYSTGLIPLSLYRQLLQQLLAMESKDITVLGSTGSVGNSTLDLIRFHGNSFRIRALTANKNADLLIKQAIEFSPELVAIGDETLFQQVDAALSGKEIKVVAGMEGISEAASFQTDVTVAAIMGMVGLQSAIAALGNARSLAIANKEPLVAAGQLFLDKAREKGTKILPLDSEHNAIFQVFENDNRTSIEKIILTASGGPFRSWTLEQTEFVTPEQALKHPNWSMGAKISIDSATMMNKALEIIEAHHLFNMSADKIDVLIHPQSIIHSMVSYKDGSVLAQLGAPDMRTPIAYALAWPERMETSGAKLDWQMIKNLEFYQPDFEQFPALKMAYNCLQAEPSSFVILNAANEIAVDAFLKRMIGFNDILRVSKGMLESIASQELNNFDDVIFFDKSVREQTKSYIKNITA